MARFYSDENFPGKVVLHLRGLGHDVLTIQENGLANQGTPDSDVLAIAAADSRAVLTMNRKHFIRLHRNRPDHSGIVVCTADMDVFALAGRIDHRHRLHRRRDPVFPGAGWGEMRSGLERQDFCRRIFPWE